MVRTRLAEPLPEGRLDGAHYRALHRYVFQDVYAWAGRYRNIRTHKGAATFCFPEHIEREMRGLFAGLVGAGHFRGLDRRAFAQAAAGFVANLNAIHPFREGNGRVQQAFLVLLAERAGHAIDLNRVRRRTYLPAMIAAHHEDETHLANLIESWII